MVGRWARAGHRHALCRFALDWRVTADVRLLDHRNRWIPNWLERILPQLDVERVVISATEGGT